MSLGEHLKHPAIQKYAHPQPSVGEEAAHSPTSLPQVDESRRPKSGADLERDIGLISNLMSMADRDVRKSWSRVERLLLKKRQAPPARPSTANNAFKRPRTLTDACASFFGGPQASRIDLTRKFSSQVKAKDLQVADNKRYFRLDSAMQAALNTDETECTWTRLPALLKNCFAD
jgi:chromatin remodeling complex protein RSC6